MYYPKSQIKTNLSTDGSEFILVSTGEKYSGFYHELSNGKTFTGRTPYDPPVKEIIRNEGTMEETPPSLNTVSSQVPNIYTFLQGIEIGKEKKLPSVYIPNPQESDYTLGQITRYFVQHISNLNYIEVSKEEFNKIQNKDNDIFWQNYKPFFISWRITGDKFKVAQINLQTVSNIIKKEKLVGFAGYLNHNYIKFLQE